MTLALLDYLSFFSRVTNIRGNEAGSSLFLTTCLAFLSQEDSGPVRPLSAVVELCIHPVQWCVSIDSGIENMVAIV